MITKQLFLEKKSQWVAANGKPERLYINSGEEFVLEWVFNCNTEEVLRVRNQEDVLKMMTDPAPISKVNHEQFLSKYDQLPRIDFMVCSADKKLPIGGCNCALTKNGIELGKYIGNSNYLGKGLAKSFTQLFITMLIEHFYGYELVARTRKENKRNIMLNKKLGFTTSTILDQEYILMKRTLK